VRRAQAPYAITAALVLVVSLAVLVGALAAGGLLEERIGIDASPAPSASRAPIELSRTGRIAYWRTDAGGDVQLFVANLDGSNRRAVARIDSLSRVQATRWSPDGNAIAWLDRGQAVVVQRIGGAGERYDLPLPQSLVAANARLIDLDWSTDSASIAATLRGGTQGIPNAETDVYVAPATGGSWRNATALGNAFLSQWISSTELLIHSGNGMIAVQRADGTSLTPLTGLVATSPFVGEDGRVYFFAGQVAPTIRDATVPVINVGQARVWSMTIDGGDVRQEIPQPNDDVRLVTQWSPGRFVVHQGASTALAFLASGQPLATIPGVIDRVVFSPDRRVAIGLSGSRIVRYDTARPEAPVVLLSDVTQPDAWYPDTVTLARASATPAPVRPIARYVFRLHGLLWTMDATGGVHLVRPLAPDDGSIRRLSGIALPQWSPRGDRILVFDVSRFRGSVFVTDVTGTATRLSDQDAAGPFPTWSPGGDVAYTDLLFSFDSAGFGAAGEVRIVNPTSSARVATYRAREIAFGGGRTYLIDNGRLESPAGYTDHAILEATAPGSRTVTTAAVLDAGSAFAGRSPGPATQLQLSMLGASADGEYLSVRISPASGNSPFTFAILRTADGAPMFRLPGQAIDDVRWSPNGHLVGMTIGNIPGVRDADTGAIVASAGSGRFAGWSPDGKWFYVARDTGLYAQLLSGGEPVRISALGVPVSTATP
jgi:Tol biopolymer transport system component